MTERVTLDRRLALCRLAVWFSTLLITFVFFREEFPLAWQVAAFGTLFTLIWPIARRTQMLGSNAASYQEEEAKAEGNEAETPEGLSEGILASLIDVGMDLVVITALVDVTGGFNSIFSPFYFFAVLESYALLGQAQAIYTALAAAVLSLVHLRLRNVNAHAALVYGVAMGTLLISAIMVGLRKGADEAGSEETAERPEGRFARMPRAAIQAKLRAVEALEQKVEELDASNRQLKSTYREVALLNREQRTQIDRMRSAEHLFESSLVISGEIEPVAAYARLLRIVMEALEAGGGALWLREAHSDILNVQATEGRIAPLIRAGAITGISDLPPGELRALCEDKLLAAAPVAAFEASRLAVVEIAETEEGVTDPERRGMATTARPVLAVLLREATAEGSAVGAIFGAVGLCDPRGAARFSPADMERLQSLVTPLATAFSNVRQQYRLQKRVREISLLYDLSRLVQSATDMNQVYKAVVSQVQQVVPHENITLFLVDKTHSQLVAKATIGRAVNLLDHIPFAKGQGVSGWVAGRGKQIVIPDLTLEKNLLNVEMIPPRIRSFVAIPLKVRQNVVGVLNLSHSQPHAFSPDDIQLLTILAGQAAVTIENTEVFHTLENLAITDGLTQVYNHRFFQLRLEEEMKRGKRYNMECSVMLLDADNFKHINDQYGHATGDLVLSDLAALLKRSVRDTELVARYGGEEFALILPQTGTEQALIAADRVRASVAGHEFRSTDGQPIKLTVSVGVATSPVHAEKRAELVEKADRALYAAKGKGRNQVASSDGEIVHAVTSQPPHRSFSPSQPVAAETNGMGKQAIYSPDAPTGK